MSKGRYYTEMLYLIESELKNENLEKMLDKETKDFFANQNLFISDVYNIINLLKTTATKNNRKTIPLKEFKKILNEYEISKQ